MSNKKVQLFVLPFAGGSTAAFREFCHLVNEKIEVYVIEYPGRGSRIRESFCKSMDSLIADAKRQIKEKRKSNLPFALMGYSMGVEVAFDLAQYALGEKAEHLFFAAREAICYDTKGHDYALCDRDTFTKKIIALGGIDDRVLKNKKFLDIYMRPIYADYRLLHDYVYQRERGSLDSDFTIFYCEEDTPYTKVQDWRQFTTGRTDFFEMGDNHFFLNQHAEEMAKIIYEKLSPIWNE